MTVRELCDRMDAAEFAEWVAFAAVEPFGSQVDDVRLGTLASAVVAPHGGKTRPGEWFQWEPAEATGSWRDILAGFGAFVAKPEKGAASGG